MKIETKTNGYEAEGIQEMITRFEKVAADLFQTAQFPISTTETTLTWQTSWFALGITRISTFALPG